MTVDRWFDTTRKAGHADGLEVETGIHREREDDEGDTATPDDGEDELRFHLEALGHKRMQEEQRKDPDCHLDFLDFG